VTVQQAWKAVAVLFTIFALAAGILFLRLHWQPGVDFDPTGFFWLIRNLGRLSLLLLFLLCSGAALSYWLRALGIRE
jgi:hypothetical protein